VAGEPAGTAFEASLVIYADAVLFQLINIGGAEIEAGLIPAFFHAYLAVHQPQVRFLIHVKSVQK